MNMYLYYLCFYLYDVLKSIDKKPLKVRIKLLIPFRLGLERCKEKILTFLFCQKEKGKINGIKNRVR